MANGITIQKQTSNTLNNPISITVLPKSLSESFNKATQKYSAQVQSLKDYRKSLTLGEDVAEELALKELKDYKSDNTQKIIQKYDQKQETIDQKSQKNETTFNNKLNSLTENFENAKKDLSATSIEKGWKNSSIYEREKKELETSFDESKKMLEKEYDENKSTFDFQKTLLEEEKRKALENFDISYAQKVSKKIDELTLNFEKANKTDIAKVDTRLEQLQNMTNQAKAKQLLEYLKTYSKAEAKEFLRFHEKTLLNELGSQVFRAVKSEF